MLITGLDTFWGGRMAQALEAEPGVEMILGKVHKRGRQRTRVGVAKPVEQRNRFASQVATTGAAAVTNVGGARKCDGSNAR